MPLEEIEERFTKSDLAIVGWRSQEVSFQMDEGMKRGSASAGPPANAYLPETVSVPTGLPEKFFNKEGELDLRGVTGPEALRFLRMQGINVPFIPAGAPPQSAYQPSVAGLEVFVDEQGRVGVRDTETNDGGH